MVCKNAKLNYIANRFGALLFGTPFLLCGSFSAQYVFILSSCISVPLPTLYQFSYNSVKNWARCGSGSHY